MAHVYNPTQPRAPRGMPRGGQWTKSGNAATLKPRGKRTGAHGGKKPRGLAPLRHTGRNPFTQQLHHDDTSYLMHAYGDSSVHSSTPIPKASRAPRPSWRRTM